jgi:hypothetical protein
MYLRYGLQTMREWLRSGVEKARHLDRFFSHVLQVTDDILRLPAEERVKKSINSTSKNILFICS